jgi:hypothetical protein
MMNETDNASRDYQKCKDTLKNAKEVLDNITATLPEYDDTDWTAGLSKAEKVIVLFFSIQDYYSFQGIAEIAQALDAADAHQLGALLDAHYGAQYYENDKNTEVHMMRYRVHRLFSHRKVNLRMMARLANIGPQYPVL